MKASQGPWTSKKPDRLAGLGMLGLKAEIEKMETPERASGLELWNTQNELEKKAECTACARHAGQERIRAWLRKQEQEGTS